MQRVFTVRCLAAVAAFSLVLFLAACGGSNKANTKVAKILVSPTTISLNEGGVATLSAVGQNSDGAVIATDITFTSSNTAIAHNARVLMQCMLGNPDGGCRPATCWRP